MGQPNRGPEITGVTILFLILTWIVVILRFYVRARITKRIFTEDWLTLLCLLLFTVYGGYGIAGVYFGAGQHLYDVPPQNIKSSLKVWYICEIFYAVTCSMIRFTVGVFLLRFARLKTQRWIIFGCQTVNVVYNVIYLAAIVYQCIPLSYFWTRFDPDSHGICFDASVGVKMTLGNTIVAAVTDWVLGLLPIWILWNSNMNNTKKAAVCLMLGLGVFASAAPLVRIPHIYGLFNTVDFLWATTDIAIWSVVELGVGIFVISLHSLKPLFKAIPLFSRLSSTGSGGPSNASSEPKTYQVPYKH